MRVVIIQFIQQKKLENITNEIKQNRHFVHNILSSQHDQMSNAASKLNSLKMQIENKSSQRRTSKTMNHILNKQNSNIFKEKHSF